MTTERQPARRVLRSRLDPPRLKSEALPQIVCDEACMNAKEIAELRLTESLQEAFARDEVNIRHPDHVGVSHRPEPKSIHSGLPASRFGLGPKKRPKERLPKRPGVLVRHSRVYKPGVEY